MKTNFRDMLEALALYAKSDRAPELREVVKDLVNDEWARRKRTAARMRHLRVELRDCDFAYRLGLEDRRQAVEAARGR